jgi:hypothetical protein
MATRRVSYKVKCRGCGREFLVDKPMSLIPKHSLEGKERDFGVYIPCPGSGHTGIPVDTLYH